MRRYLIELQLPSESRADFARLMRVMRSARVRIDNGSAERHVGEIGLASSSQRTYCILQATSASLVATFMQTAMLPGRILRITELDPRRR